MRCFINTHTHTLNMFPSSRSVPTSEPPLLFPFVSRPPNTHKRCYQLEGAISMADDER